MLPQPLRRRFPADREEYEEEEATHVAGAAAGDRSASGKVTCVPVSSPGGDEGQQVRVLLSTVLPIPYEP